MDRTDEFKLVGHLQVLDEPLASLYVNMADGCMYCFVRIYDENSDDALFVLSLVDASEMMDYMEGRVGLSGLFSDNQNYYFNASHHDKLSYLYFEPRDKQTVLNLLTKGGLKDRYDKSLGYRRTSLMRYLRSHKEPQEKKETKGYEESVYCEAG